MAARLLKSQSQLPPFVMIPGPIENTGVKVPHGQSSGWLGPEYEPFHLNDDPASDRYNPGRALDRTRRLIDGLTQPGSRLMQRPEPYLRSLHGTRSS